MRGETGIRKKGVREWEIRSMALNGRLLDGEEAGDAGSGASLHWRNIDELQVPGYTCGRKATIMSTNRSCRQ